MHWFFSLQHEIKNSTCVLEPMVRPRWQHPDNSVCNKMNSTGVALILFWKVIMKYTILTYSYNQNRQETSSSSQIQEVFHCHPWKQTNKQTNINLDYCQLLRLCFIISLFSNHFHSIFAFSAIRDPQDQNKVEYVNQWNQQRRTELWLEER